MPLRKQALLQALAIFVAMSVLFPLLWVLSLALDPTERLRPAGLIPSGATLDNFAEVVRDILREAKVDPVIAKNAPYDTPVRRLDESGAARRQVVRQPRAEAASRSA